jgi:broad specificity phosphatase PhoE
MQITYFVHSITKDNEQGLATGWMQGELSAEGIKRAKTLTKDLSSRNFDAVFCSDLERAIQSTKIFFNDRYPVFIDWRLRECNYGDLDGTPAKDFKKNREQEYIDTVYPNGESYKDVEIRMRSFLNDANHRYKNKHIAIVAHQAPQLALDVIVNNKTWEQAIADDWRKTGAWQPGWNYTTMA